MIAKLEEMIKQQTGVEDLHLEVGSTFKEDLKIDSLDMFEILMQIEDEFGVSIPAENLPELKTVGDLMKYIEEHK